MITKLSPGCFGLALAYLVMAAAAWMTDDGKASALWLAVYFLIITVAELYFPPPALALVSRLAPERSRSLILGVWLTTNFTGNFSPAGLAAYGRACLMLPSFCW
jgi:POT family proton-dependent oligopeptide transporter